VAKNGWLNDQFDEVRRDLDKWDKSRLNAARKEVNAIGSKLATSARRKNMKGKNQHDRSRDWKETLKMGNEMKIDSRNMPGPGDVETWGPCTGHPGDPRTEDPTETAEFEEKQREMWEERMTDPGWISEAVSEAAYYTLLRLGDACLKCEDPPTTEQLAKIGRIVFVMQEVYNWPKDEDVMAKGT